MFLEYKLVSEKLVRSNKIFPLFKAQNTMNLAVVDPLDPEPINLIREETGLNVEPILCLEEDIINAIEINVKNKLKITERYNSYLNS